jgi:PTH1 family peptidyl-tRNA hydrolase
LFVIVGLGNPGKEYAKTRHNVGFDTIDLLASRNNIDINKSKFKGKYGEGFIGKERVLLLKPQTYMNRSGESVLDIYNFYKIPIDKLIVVLDDIDIEFGTIRIKKKGSAGTHNGMKSVIYQLQRDDFPRVKIGIGNNKEGQDLADFVLGSFSREDRIIIDKAILKACEAVETIVTSGVNEAMNEYNRKNKDLAQD